MRTWWRSSVDIVIGVIVTALISLLLTAVMRIPADDSVPSAVSLTPSRLGSEVGCYTAPLTTTPASHVRGRGQLCLVDGGVRPGIAVENLEPGTLYSTWLLYFDQPHECQARICSDSDLLGDRSLGILVRMDAQAADASRQALLWGNADGLRLTRPSQFTLALLAHGPAAIEDGPRLNRQLFRLSPALPFARLQLDPQRPDEGFLVGTAVFVLK